MTEYITQAEIRRQKTALHRAVNSRVPVQVLATVERTLTQWHGKAWPDDWARWARALDDAYYAFVRADHGEASGLYVSGVVDRFHAAFDELH